MGALADTIIVGMFITALILLSLSILYGLYLLFIDYPIYKWKTRHWDSKKDKKWK